jgi:hypothetical protein
LQRLFNPVARGGPNQQSGIIMSDAIEQSIEYNDKEQVCVSDDSLWHGLQHHPLLPESSSAEYGVKMESFCPNHCSEKLMRNMESR